MLELCFAYGSNQSLTQLRDRGVTLFDARPCVLPDYRFAFDKASSRPEGTSRANVVHDIGRRVYGTLLSLSPGGVERLRTFETGYELRKVLVQALDGSFAIEAVTFVAPEQVRRALPAPPRYVARILEALRDRAAPAAWLDTVEREAALAPSAFSVDVCVDPCDAAHACIHIDALLVGLRRGTILPDSAEARQFCVAALEAQRPDGSWNLLAEGPLPRELHVDFVARPTRLVAAILAHCRGSAVPLPALARALAAVATVGLEGHGIGATKGLVDAVHELSDGGIPSLLADDPALCPALAACVDSARSRLAQLAPRLGAECSWGRLPRFVVEDALARVAPA